MDNKISVSPEQEKFIIQAIKRELPKAKIIAFGSRIRGDAHTYSDLDLAINDGKSISLSKLSHLEEIFAESDIPFKIDLIDFQMVDLAFQSIIKSQGKAW